MARDAYTALDVVSQMPYRQHENAKHETKPNRSLFRGFVAVPFA